MAVDRLFDPEIVRSDAGDGRIPIPQKFSDRVRWISGTEQLRVWLLMLLPGRFRLLSDSQVQGDGTLSEIRSAIMDGPAELAGSAVGFESSERAAMIGRLIPVNLAPPGPCWRLTLPKPVLPDDKDRRRFVFLFSLGYLEIWLLDVYKAAQALPLDSVI